MVKSNDAAKVSAQVRFPQLESTQLDSTQSIPRVTRVLQRASL